MAEFKQFSHRDQVQKAPENWEVVGHSPYCEIQAMKASSMPIWTVQWHPEADLAFLDENPAPPWEELENERERVTKLSGNKVFHDFLAFVGAKEIR